MAIRLVQIARGSEVRVALVEEPELRLLAGVGSVVELAQRCVEEGCGLEETARSLAGEERVSYDEVYAGRGAWRLVAPVHAPEGAARLLVSGTGLTHLGSARQRQAMHLAAKGAEKARVADAAVTDSMRMFQWGVDQGRPAEGEIGIAPEWFYKGDGAMLRDPGEALEIPSHAEDGGEEAEIAGVYVVSASGEPWRIGLAQGNEFSDHRFEKRNYLNLAGSKLRSCSLGPELVVGGSFGDVAGRVRITREERVVWEKEIASGEQNMCHSLANLEHHHFKFAGHRQPGSVHVHFFGADALSFGAGVVLEDGDVMEVQFDGFGRALRNPVRVEEKSDRPWRVRSLA